MWKRFVDDQWSLINIAVSVSAMLACVVIFGFVYATFDAPIQNRIFGMIFMSFWTSSPFFASIIAAYLFVGRSKASMAVMFGTVANFVYAAYLYLQVMVVNPNDGQGGFALVVLPFVQWLIVGLATAIAGGIVLLTRRRHA